MKPKWFYWMDAFYSELDEPEMSWRETIAWMLVILLGVILLS